MKKRFSTKGLGAALSMLAALIVYELGKAGGALLIRPLAVWMLQSKAAAQEAAVNGLYSLTMQLTGGLVCLLVWRRELAGKWRGRESLPDAPAGKSKRPREGQDGSRLGSRGEGRPLLPGSLSFFGLAVSLPLGLNLLLSLLPLAKLSPSFQETAASQAAVPVWLGLALYGLAAPFSEELVFRGILYGRARQLFGKSAAMLFSGLLFGIYHGNLVQGVYGALLGTLLCFLYEREGSLLAPVIFHGTANLAVYLCFDVWRVGERILEAGTMGAAAVCGTLLAAAGICLWAYGGLKREKKEKN